MCRFSIGKHGKMATWLCCFLAQLTKLQLGHRNRPRFDCHVVCANMSSILFASMALGAAVCGQRRRPTLKVLGHKNGDRNEAAVGPEQSRQSAESNSQGCQEKKITPLK